MVDVSLKDVSAREATATGCITMNEAAWQAMQRGEITKGSVCDVARLAGIMALKQTAHLIPLCHPVAITYAALEFSSDAAERCLDVTCTVRASGVTGVEMEALTGVSVALLTVYDMCKALDKAMVIHDICLLAKSGGKSGNYRRVMHHA